MADARPFSCPYCSHDATLRDQDCVTGSENLTIQQPVDGHRQLAWYYVVCPNPKCRKSTLRIGLFPCIWNEQTEEWEAGEIERLWHLLPHSKAKSFPDYIPKAILDDYSEACLISELSPKAAATLARRCLQGILRDFWRVKPGRLVDEIDQVKDKTDPLTWEAIDSLRRVGNVGAHMSKDIDVIVEVDPNEAVMLTELIETLLKDWYITQEERKSRLLKIRAIAEEKGVPRRDAPTGA